MLVFALPPGGAPVPFTVTGLLAALPRLKLVTDADAGIASPLPAPPPTPSASAIVAAAAQRRATARPAAARVAAAPVGGPATGPDALVERIRRTAARTRTPLLPDGNGASEAKSAGTTTAASAVPQPALAAALGSRVTALHLPGRMALSPRGGATRFRHAADPTVREGRVPLWHTSLVRLRADGALVEAPADLVALRTNEMPDGGSTAWRQRVGDPRLTKQGLNALNRKRLVDQTLGELRPDGSRKGGRPLSAEQLLLSPLGAWLDMEGSWDRDDDPLKSLRYRMAMGRDVLVRVVSRGILFPLRHDAILTQTTRREFTPTNGGVATLVTKQVLTVVEPTRTYNATDPAGRGMPWQSITVLTRSVNVGGTQAFDPAGSLKLLDEDQQPLTFRCRGIDRGGRTTEFAMRLLFVPDAVKDLGPVAAKYNLSDLRKVELGGQVLAVAPATPEAPDAADVVAEHVMLTTAVESTSSGNRVTLTSASIRGALPALQRFAKGTAGALELSYARPYLDHVFDPQRNAGQLLLQIAGAPPVVDLGDPKVTGGMVAPQFPMTALSRLAGPVGGQVANLATGKVKAVDVLGTLLDDVRLFGVFPLADLIGALDLDVGKDVPQLVTHALDGLSLPQLRWRVPLFRTNGDAVDALAVPGGGPVSGKVGPIPGRDPVLVLDVTSELQQPVNPAAPVVHTSTTCRIENVLLTLGLLGQDLVRVPVEHISFTSKDGAKPDLDAKLGDLEFDGVLAFVATLAAMVPKDAFSDPPALELTDDGVRSSVALPLPPLAVGAFLLENITFSTALELSFSKPPSLELDFATPANRFRLTVLCLGGGGYLGVVLSTRGLERLDGMLEFGAALAVNLGVARGSVSVMGGIAFTYDFDDGARLSGYLEVRGELEVLGLIEVGVKLLVMLTYDFPTRTLSGEARMEVSVKLLFLHKTVSVPFHYTFAGGGSSHRALAGAAQAAPTQAGMPGFLDQMAPAGLPAGTARPWDTYCLAFA
jgi:hypothetical protein